MHALRATYQSYVKSILESFFIWCMLPSIVMFCATTSPQIAPMFYSDTVTHIATFFALMLAFGFRCKTLKAIFCALLLLVAFGCIIEIVQSYLPYRHMSISDMIANISGLGLGLLSLFIFKRVFKT